MSIFICEKCGCLANSADGGTYWHATMNIHRLSKKQPIDIGYKPEYEFFETHRCCENCADGVEFGDGSGVLHKEINYDEMTHWSQLGKEKLLELEKRGDGSAVNASYFFNKGFDKLT